MTIIESIQGEIALQYKTKDHTGKVTTPLRRLFKKMPGIFMNHNAEALSSMWYVIL